MYRPQEPQATPRIKAIPTTYKGVEFRSKLERNVAACFDACGVEWAYEQEGYSLDDVWYLPDFWLPKAKQFVEVKGQADDPSLDKCIKLAHLVRGDLDDEEEYAQPAAVVVLSAPFVRLHIGVANEVFGFGFNGVEQVDSLLVRCPKCDARFFMTTEQSWQCSACGKWSDMNDLRPVLVRVDHRLGVTNYRSI